MPKPFASPLWRNDAFVRVWSAATISIFGSLITRIALPLVAILTLSAGPIEVAVLRGMDLAALLVVGLVAGAWVDRLKRRPVLIGADLGRAVLLGSIPIAFVFGALTFWHLLVVTVLAAILTAFFDAADNAYLPSIVERERLVEANSALAASGSVAEFVGFGISGILVQVLTGPITILIDAVTYVVSAVLLVTVRKPEAPPPKVEDRAPMLDEIRHGLRLVAHDPILRSFAAASMLLAALWGVFGATWFLFSLETLGLSPALVGIVAGVGGASSFIGAVVATRSTTRWGVGQVAVAAMLLSALGNLFIPLAPAGLPLIALACLVAQQLIADSAATVYEVTEVSVRQALVKDRELGRVAATFSVLAVGAQLVATIGAGLLAEVIGLRAVAFLAPLGGLIGAAILWWSPVRRLRDLPVHDGRSAAEIAVDVERDQPVGA
ncbi:MAG TPA: MFS transporter [Candidatus Saccharimonadales bacterium]|nr:MFS transporter [Candidatus Saccharimonadales bacterium]